MSTFRQTLSPSFSLDGAFKTKVQRINQKKKSKTKD